MRFYSSQISRKEKEEPLANDRERRKRQKYKIQKGKQKHKAHVTNSSKSTSHHSKYRTDCTGQTD